MLLNLLLPFADDFGVLNVVRYLTFRSMAAVLTALLICFIFGPWVIRTLRRLQGDGPPIREDVPEEHLLRKKVTPSMGGLLILMAVGIATLLWADLSNGYVWITLFVTMGFGCLGFADDYLKVVHKNSKGVSGRIKLLVQITLSLLAAIGISWMSPPEISTALMLPFLKDVFLPLGYAFFLLAILVIVGTSNAVNLTDGLDGLAIVPTMIAAGCFGLISYLIGHSVFAAYLAIPYVAGTGELSVICAAFLGAGLGFLWFNAPPAQVFMGDTGSLSAGGALGTIAVATKHELVLMMIGGLFVLEAVSVIVQVISFKLTGKRVFRMAPLHHHFEKKGWEESTIVIRFWIIATILALIGLSTLKLR